MLRPLIAIDPGPVESAFVIWNGNKILRHGKHPNAEVLNDLWSSRHSHVPLYVEMVASYGMAVGAEVFETCVWIGRFTEAYGGAERVTRIKVKTHLCHDSRAKDSNIRQALIDRFGKPGTKKEPGTTYGLKADEWQAFALAVYAFDTLEAA